MSPKEIKKLRKELKISRVELAALTAIPTSHIENIEEENIVPLKSDLQRLEKALKTYHSRENQSE